jgi:hypothetical protein
LVDLKWIIKGMLYTEKRGDIANGSGTSHVQSYKPKQYQDSNNDLPFVRQIIADPKIS